MKAIDTLRAVSKDFKVSILDIQNDIDHAKISEARRCYGYLCIENKDIITEDLAKCAKLINRSRSVMYHYHKTVAGYVERNFLLLTRLKLVMFHVKKERCNPCKSAITFNYTTL